MTLQDFDKRVDILVSIRAANTQILFLTESECNDFFEWVNSMHDETNITPTQFNRSLIKPTHEGVDCLMKLQYGGFLFVVFDTEKL